MTNPCTLDECVDALAEKLSVEDRSEIYRMSKKDLISLHHGLGRWIRNNWGLWSSGPLYEYMKSLGFIHPDDMSQSIIHEYWNRLHNNVSEISQDVQKYKEFWENKNET